MRYRVLLIKLLGPNFFTCQTQLRSARCLFKNAVIRINLFIAIKFRRSPHLSTDCWLHTEFTFRCHEHRPGDLQSTDGFRMYPNSSFIIEKEKIKMRENTLFDFHIFRWLQRKKKRGRREGKISAGDSWTGGRTPLLKLNTNVVLDRVYLKIIHGSNYLNVFAWSWLNQEKKLRLQLPFFIRFQFEQPAAIHSRR